jgi:hypothetical protein
MTGDRLGGVADRLWSRHSNPRSVWSLFLAFPVLVAALYRRDRRLLAATLAAVALNPLVVAPPEDDDAWATRVVRGERAWLDRGLASSTADLAFLALSAPVVVFALGSAARRRPVRTAVGTALSMVLILVFFGRMARLYDRWEADRSGNGGRETRGRLKAPGRR